MVLPLNTAVTTAYGDGQIVSYDNNTNVYTIRLAFGTLYAVQSSLLRRTPGVAELNAAYESLERMRKLNLEVTAHEMGIPVVDHEVCTMCLLGSSTNITDKEDPRAKKQQRWKMISKLPKGGPSLKKGTPCLICGSPTCPKHQSAAFKKQSIVLCHNCENLFDLDFASLLGLEDPNAKQKDKNDPKKESSPTNSVSTKHEIDTKLLEQKTQTLVDTYDRVMLLLAHAAQFIPALVLRLGDNEARNNRIGVGTAGAGVLSGALGLAGAATILTPMGAPLLMASLALSGSSAAVTVGNHTFNYYQKPHEGADRIIVMHGMISSLLNAAQTLQRLANQGEMMEQNDDSNKNPDKQDAVLTGTVGQGLQLVRQADTGLNLANAAATSSATLSTAAPGATNFIQSSASALNAVPLLGTALSGIFIAMDANRLQSTLAKIKAGNPSDKADALRNLQGDLLLFPQTADLEVECTNFCQVVEKNLPSKGAK